MTPTTFATITIASVDQKLEAAKLAIADSLT